jgi:hypothetical protein
MNNPELLPFSLVIYVITLILAYIFGCQATEADAVDNGVGEYYVDEDNKRKFRWKKL